MAVIKKLTRQPYAVTCNDILAVVGYVKGVGGACAVKQAVEYLSSQMPERDWRVIVNVAVAQKELVRSFRRLFTLSEWQSYQRKKLIKKGLA